MPRARAALERTRCRAVSKRSGERCKRYCSPGFLTCRLHGGGSPQAKRSAQVRAAVAEVLAANPRRSMREVIGDAVHVADLVLSDEIAKLRDADALTTAAADQLVVAAGRASALAQQALSVGIDVDRTVDERQAEEDASVLVGVLRRLGGSMLAGLRAPSSDYLEVERWLLGEVPRLLREPDAVPAPCPRPWVLASLPALESGEVFRRREDRSVGEALGGSVSGAGAVPVSGSSGAVNAPGRRQSSPAPAGSESPRQREARLMAEVGRTRSSLVPSSPYGGRS